MDMDSMMRPFLSASADTPDLPDSDYDDGPIPEPGEAGRIEAIEALAYAGDPRSSAELSEEV